MKTNLKILLCFLPVCAITASAQLAVTVMPIKVVGQKAVIELKMRNDFSEKIESARAMCFLLDEQGKMVGQKNGWVVGGTKDGSALEPKKEATFNFVIPVSDATQTNVATKISFTRIVLVGGRMADPNKDVLIVQPKNKQ